MIKQRKKEAEIQDIICEWLAIKGYFFWRQNTIPLYDPRKKIFRRMPRYAKKGVSDIILIYKGRIFCLEVKRPGGTLSKNQKDFRNGLLEARGEYYVVNSLEEVEAIMIDIETRHG